MLSFAILLLLMLWNTLPLHPQDTGKAKQEVTLNSPDGKIRFQLEHRFEGGKRALYYTVHFKDQPVVLPSEMDIQLDNHISDNPPMIAARRPVCLTLESLSPSQLLATSW